MNQFYYKEYPCTLYGEKGHTFDTWKESMNTYMKDAYIWLCIIVNSYCGSFQRIYLTGQKCNHDFNIVYHLTLHQSDTMIW